MKIGFIGLGIMGSRMVTNLLKAGYELVVFNRTQSKAAPLVALGAELTQSPEEVARKCTVLFTMLATPEAVEDAAIGDQGFLKALPENSLWVDCSTVNPSFTQKMAQYAKNLNQRFLDAPVAGSLIPAEKGELLFLVGGEAADVRQVQELLDIMGKATVHVGAVGQGTSMKIINNMLLGQAMVAFAEALHLGKALGIAEEMLFRTLLNGPTAAPFLKLKEEKLINRDFTPEFPLEWMHKDLHLVAITAYEQEVAIPSLQTTKEIYALAKQFDLGQKDFSAVYQLFTPVKKDK